MQLYYINTVSEGTVGSGKGLEASPYALTVYHNGYIILPQITHRMKSVHDMAVPDRELFSSSLRVANTLAKDTFFVLSKS